MELLKRSYRFAAFVARRFYDDRCLPTATALAYTSLLSLVPLLTVVFSIVSAFPVFQETADAIQEYIFANFVPATGAVVQDYLERFLRQTSRLSGVGSLFLVLTALILIDTIEAAINRIWRTSKRRSLPIRMMVYWSVLTLGPLLLAVSIGLTSYVTSLPVVAGVSVFHSLGTALLALLPFFTTTLALSVLYIIVPNCNVPIVKGVAAAAFAAALFELAKLGFTLYVARGPAYTTIYGALAVVPLFLFWIYVSWVLVLLGAELAYCLTTYQADRRHPVSNKAARELLSAFRVVGHLWRAQLRGEAVSTQRLLKLEPALQLDALNAVLQRLYAGMIVQRSDTGDWLLARDAAELDLIELYQAFPAPLAGLEGRWTEGDDWNRALYRRLAASRGAVDTALRVPLKSLYQYDEMHDGTGEQARRS